MKIDFFSSTQTKVAVGVFSLAVLTSIHSPADAGEWFECGRGYELQLKDKNTKVRCYRKGDRRTAEPKCPSNVGFKSRHYRVDYRGVEDYCVNRHASLKPECGRLNLKTKRGPDICRNRIRGDIRPPDRSTN